jgi:hypothetical protein
LKEKEKRIEEEEEEEKEEEEEDEDEEEERRRRRTIEQYQETTRRRTGRRGFAQTMDRQTGSMMRVKGRHMPKQADSIIQQTSSSGPGDASMCKPMDPGGCIGVMPGVSGMPNLAPSSSGPGGLSSLQAQLHDLFNTQTLLHRSLSS